MTSRAGCAPCGTGRCRALGSPAPQLPAASARTQATRCHRSDNQSVRQSEPRSRKPASETRARLLAVAVDRVRGEGLLLDYSNIELEDLIRVSGVPRSTVFRIWPDRVAFVADLVRALFEADPGFQTGFDGETLELLEGTLAHAGDQARSQEDQQIALRSMVQATVAHNIVAVDGSVAWRAYRTMSAALASGDSVPGGAEIRALLSEIEGAYVDRMAVMYARLNGAIGFRMRQGVTERDLAVAIMSVIDGMSDHRRIDPAFIDEPRFVDMGAEGAQGWHLAALAVYGVYSCLTEPVSKDSA